MTKHIYKAVHFHQVDWAKLIAECGGERAVVAIDAAKTGFVAAVMSPQRRALVTFKWSHPRDTQAVVEAVAGLSHEVEAVLEPTGTYGDPLRYQLYQAGVTVYRMPAKRVSDAKELYDGVPSLHDGKSAYVIARLHLEGISDLWRESDTDRRTLQAYSNRLSFCREQAQRTHNRLEAQLARHWPEAPEILGLRSTSLVQLLAQYGSPAAVATDAEAARTTLQRTGGRFLRSDKVDALIASAGSTVGVPCLEAEAEGLRALAEQLLTLRRECRVLERALAAETRADPGLAQQASAVGRVSAAVLRADLGDPRAYPNAGSYAKAAGLHLKEHSSGRHKGQLRLTKRGPGTARQYAYFAVLRLIRHEGPARRWYEAKVARDGGCKRKAIAALMRKLIKALWHVGQGEPFDETRLFQSMPMDATA